MLLASKISSYVKSVHTAIMDDKSILPLADSLGLSIESATIGLESGYDSLIASGCTPVGRKLIHSQIATQEADLATASFGYLYDQDLLYSDGTYCDIRLPKKNQVSVAPMLVVRLSGDPSSATTFEKFSEMVDAVASGFEILSIPFKEKSWKREDVICANGFGYKQVLGEMRGLSRASRKNIDEIMSCSAFSFSCVDKNGSRIRGYSSGRSSEGTSLRKLHAALRCSERMTGRFPIHDGDLLALTSLCDPMEGFVGEEWVFSTNGIQLSELRARLVK